MEFAKKTRKPVIVIAPDFNSEALTAMVVNNLKGVAELVAIKTPIEGNDMPILQDIASFSGGQVVSMGLGERVGRVDPVRVLGKVTSAQIEKGKTVLVGGHGRIKKYNEDMSGLEQRAK